MLNRTEYLLVKLAEECGEVAQRATKALTFGIDEVQRDQPFTNAERIVQELADLSATVDALQELSIITLDHKAFSEMKQRKRLRMDWYMEYSRQNGCLA